MATATTLPALAWLLGAALVLAWPVAAQHREPRGIRVGEELLPLRLPTIDGGTVELARFRGQKLLLVEFASW